MLCVAVAEKNIDKILQILNQVEIAEIRMDLIEPSSEDIVKIFQAHPNLIATCRVGKYDDEIRSAMLKQAIEAGAAYVDIEIDASAKYVKMMVDFAKEKGCKVILSFHDFEGTPEYPELIDVIDDCFVSGADIAKIATTATNQSDAARILGLYENYDNLIALAMGEEGKITRIASLFLGAPFTFVSLEDNATTAPGQISKSQMENILKSIK